MGPNHFLPSQFWQLTVQFEKLDSIWSMGSIKGLFRTTVV